MVDRYSRCWLARIVSALTRSAKRLNCSLIRFSMSPLAQYSSSYNACADQCSGLSDVTTKRGFSLPSICSAFAITRRCRSQPGRFFVLFVVWLNSAKIRAGLPVRFHCCRLPHLTSDDAPQALIARQSEHVIDFIGLAPAHQLVAAEPGISSQNNAGVWPRCANLQHNALDLRQTPGRSI